MRNLHLVAPDLALAPDLHFGAIHGSREISMSIGM